MRIRSIKSEFWRSSDISSLSIEDRLLFVGLWSYVDDSGVGKDKLAAVTADLFADDLERDPPETFARVSRGLARLSEAGRIIRYTVAGEDFLLISNWAKHQRIDKPGKARFPTPDCEGAVIRESLARPPVTLAPGTGEQGNRGTGEQSLFVHPPEAQTEPKSDLAEEFETWWKLYPRKQGKDDALKAFSTARKKASLEELTVGVSAYVIAVAGQPKNLIKMPAGWLRAGRWADEFVAEADEQASPPGWDALMQAPSRPQAPQTCPDHAHYPVPCERCREEQP